MRPADHPRYRPLSIETATSPGFFDVENWIFSHNGSERDGYYTAPLSPLSSARFPRDSLLAAKIPSCGAGRSLESSTGFRRLRWGSYVENLPLGLYSSNSRTLEKNVLTGNVFPRRRQMFTEPFIIRPSHFASRKRTVYVHAASRRNKSLKIVENCFHFSRYAIGSWNVEWTRSNIRGTIDVDEVSFPGRYSRHGFFILSINFVTYLFIIPATRSRNNIRRGISQRGRPLRPLCPRYRPSSRRWKKKGKRIAENRNK